MLEADCRASSVYQPRDILRLAGLFSIYFLTARWGLRWHAVGGVATTVWPPTGVALAFLFLGGLRLWPAVALGAFAVNFSVGVPWSGALGIACGNTAEAVLGALLLRRGGFQPALERFKDVWALLVLAGLGSTVVSATIGVLSSWASGVLPPGDFLSAWWSWWVGDMMGDLLVASLLFSWALPPTLEEAWGWRKAAALGGLLLAVSLCLLVFWTNPSFAFFQHPYFLLPLLVWIAFEFRTRGTTLTMCVLAFVAIKATEAGFGPFVESTPLASLLLLQGFLGICAATLLLLTASLAERDAAHKETLWLNEELENLATQRTAKLKQVSGHYQTLVEAVPDLISVVSLEGRIVSLNLAFEKLLGWPREQWVGREFAPLVHPEDLPKVLSELQRVASGGAPALLQFRVRTRGNDFIFMEAAARTLADNGRITGIISVARDLTERRKSEEVFRSNEERLRLLVSGIQDYAIFMLDAEGRVVSWNIGAERIKGYSAPEILGRPYACFFTPEDVRRGKPQEMLRRASAEGKAAEEGWRVRKDGARFWAEAVLTALKGPTGSLRGFAKITRDLTESRKSQLARQRLAAIVSSSQEAILSLDREGMIESWNAAAQRIYGWTEAEALGRYVGLLIPPDLRAEARDFMRRLLRGESIDQFETERLTKEGRRITVSFSAFPIRDSLGAVVGAAVMARDVTDIKLIQGLAVEIEESKKMDRLKDRLLGMVSHELRTPITIIQGALFNLGEKAAGTLSQPQERMLSLASNNAHRLTRIIENFLDMSRFESGSLAIRLRRLELAPLIRDILRDFPPGLGKSGIELEVDLPASLPSVQADPEMAAQVFINLLDNALRFAHRKVTVRAAPESGIGPGDPLGVRVSVIDDGPGIPVSAQGGLFRKFSQVNRPQGGGGYKGTGLGLALCREIMQLHHGRIWIESSEGKGCSSHLHFPGSAPALQAKEIAPARPSSTAEGV